MGCGTAAQLIHKSETMRRPNQVPVDREPDEKEAGGGDQGEFYLGSRADFGTPPNTQSGQDCEYAKENYESGGPIYEDEIFVKGMSWESGFPLERVHKQSDADDQDNPGKGG